MEDLTAARIVFVGEIHDKAAHHRAQLRIIRALHERGVPLAVGLEMFHDGHQEELDRWVAGELSVEEFQSVYLHNWSLPWPLYRDIFLFAREEALPLVALNASPEITAQVAAHGFESLSAEQVGALPGVSCNVDPDYEEFIRRAHGDHSEEGERFRYFCEAQMVWDTTMAWKVTEHLDRNEGKTMVVLAGSGHSWKKGVPEQVRRRSRLPFLTVLPETEDRLTREQASPDDTDYLWTGL